MDATPRPRSHWLTTGQAARLCSVTPDTVLKWIKKGRLPAVQTAGGHYRIDPQALQSLAPPDGTIRFPIVTPGEPPRHPLRCWEYLSQGDAVREECRKCIVYRVRAAWCFQLAGTEPDIGHARQFCGTSCEDCVYYRRIKGLSSQVLVITPDKNLIAGLAGEDNQGITLRFARNAYEASAVISEFRPALVVVDQELLRAEPELLGHLACDPRIPGAKIVLGVPRGTPRLEEIWARSRAVAGVIEKPFGRGRIAAVISSFPVESAALANAG